MKYTNEKHFNPKEEVFDYLDKNYSKIYSIAKSFVGISNAEDLINESVITIINRKKPMKSIRNKYVYFFVILKNNAFYKHSQYNKLIGNFKYNKEIIETTYDINEEDNTNVIRFSIYEELLKIADKLFEENIITWYQHKLFHLYYNNERFNDISELDLNDVNSRRKMSYRRLQDEVGIDYQSIRNSIIPVTTMIKTYLNDRNITYESLFDKHSEPVQI
jgi:DNA-directed RNA polymerase specialized sigma24 family protein